MAKKRKRGKLVQQLDGLFSLYVRHSNANLDGLVECATCDAVKPIKQMQNGHFMSRGKYATRWHEWNCAPQCPKCNLFNQGEQYKMSKHLDEKYGEGTVDEMVRLSNQTVKFADYELEEMIDEYKRKLEELS